MPPPTEGVIRFTARHETRALVARLHEETARKLAAWREVLSRLDLIGRDPARYEGLGYGNVSARVGPFGAVPRGQRRFLVTGSQTGGRASLTLADFARVEAYDLARNEVTSTGLVPPSSESLTHAAIYDVAPAVRFVFHAHAPEIWRNRQALGLPLTAPAAQNGTREMAAEVQRLFRESSFSGTGIVAMGGHEDGVLAIGGTAAEAGGALVRTLARALGAPPERV